MKKLIFIVRSNQIEQNGNHFYPASSFVSRRAVVKSSSPGSTWPISRKGRNNQCGVGIYVLPSEISGLVENLVRFTTNDG